MARKLLHLVILAALFTTAIQLGPQLAHGQVNPQGEVATLSGTIGNTQTIPLPTYRDGTVALESECSWIVSPSFVSGPVLRAMDEFHCAAPTRTVSVYACNGSPTCSNIQSGVANYLIIATRGSSGPTSSAHQTWTNVKARYRYGMGTADAR